MVLTNNNTLRIDILRGKNMKISARNGIKGKVEKVEEGPITANVKIKIEAPDEITAVITKESVKDLNIKVGDEVVAIIKATEVMIGKE
jgi:molybdopterin-binding protein